MFDSQKIGMQRLPSKGVEGGAGGGAKEGGLGPVAGAVNRVPEEWMSEVCDMNPNLVGSAGFQAAFDQTHRGFSRRRSFRIRLAFVFLQHLPVRDRLPTSLTHRHFFPRMRVPVDRRVDGPARTIRDSPGEGEISALKLPGAPVIRELRG